MPFCGGSEVNPIPLAQESSILLEPATGEDGETHTSLPREEELLTLVLSNDDGESETVGEVLGGCGGKEIEDPGYGGITKEGIDEKASGDRDE